MLSDTRPAARAAPASIARAGGEHPTRILIVEDERVLARDLAETLGGFGYVVTAFATTGEDAIAKAFTERPELIFMDVRLAGAIDGIEAARQIRAARRVAIIYLTAHSDDETLRRVKGTQPLAYLLKPFRAAELRGVVEIALDNYKSDTEVRERAHWLASTLRSIGDAVVTTDAAHNVTLLNPVAEALTGWTHDEALGRPLGDILGAVNECLEALTSERAAPIVDNQGATVGSVVLFRDVTKQRNAENVARQRNADLEARVVERTHELGAAYKELDALGFSLAQDLRAPLRTVERFSEVLLEDDAVKLGP